MGLFDSAMGMLNAVQGQDNGGDIKSKLMQAAIAMLADSAKNGGLQNLLSSFQSAGLGDIVNSWISNGQNLPISASQIMQALGGDRVGELAQSAGVSQSEAASGLADLLPGLIDKMTPNGQIPDQGDFNPAQLLGMASSLFGK
jgi:uncharacterized protein YidB (DUF937 family)